MKNNSIKYILILLLIALISCKKEKRLDLPVFQNDMVFTSSRLVDYSPKIANLEFKIAILDQLKIYGPENQGLEGVGESAFQFYNVDNYGYSIDEFKYESAQQQGPYSALLLIDNSSSNGYFQGLNFFIKNIGSESEFAISGFARGGELEQDVFTAYGNGFTNDYEESRLDLLDLANKTGGTSCYYDALDKAIDYVINNANKENKYIVTILQDDDDGNSTATLDSLIEKANDNQIKICILHHCNNEVLEKLANATGGFRGGGQLILFSLDKLLRGEFDEYKLNVKLEKYSPGNFYSGFWFSHAFTVNCNLSREKQAIVYEGYSTSYEYGTAYKTVNTNFYLDFE